MKRLVRLLGEDGLAILENFAAFSLDLVTGLIEATIHVVRERHGIHRQRRDRARK